MLESMREHERSLKCMQLLLLSSDWSSPDFGNVTNEGIRMSPDVPVLRVKIWLVRLIDKMFVDCPSITHTALLNTDPGEVADEDTILPVGFPRVDGAPSEATHTLGGSLAVDPSLYHTGFLLCIIASRGGACLNWRTRYTCTYYILLGTKISFLYPNDQWKPHPVPVHT